MRDQRLMLVEGAYSVKREEYGYGYDRTEMSKDIVNILL